jgi:anti-anti-sigma regulatory factor
VISLPIYISAQSAFAAMQVCQQVLGCDDDCVDIDAQNLRFADPFGIALLGSCFNDVKLNGRHIRVYNLNSRLGGYLQRMDLFDGIELINCSSTNGSRHNRADTLVELTMLSRHADVGNASYRLAQAIVGGFGDVDPEEPEDEMTGFNLFQRLVEPLQYALNELLENSLTHARRNGNANACVWIASQYYPSNDSIRMGVVDNGCGFLESLRGHTALNNERHLEAILLALRPRISCNRDLGIRNDSVNQGVGLTTSCRIVERAGGRMILVSGDSVHDTTGTSSESDNDSCFWQGVGIAIEFRRAMLAEVRFRELLPPLNDIPPIRLRFEQ